MNWDGFRAVMSLKGFIKEWMLPIAMLTGASVYLLYHYLPEPVHHLGPFLEGAVGVIQPLLIFSMLFLTFCRVEPRELKPHRWHWWLLLIQGGLFVLLGLGLMVVMHRLSGGGMPYVSHPDSGYGFMILMECAMLCLICPTATAAAVVARKLGGDVAGITTYTIFVNMLTAVLVPLSVPLLRPLAGVGFWTAFGMILIKVFPLLIMPCLCAWLVRYLFPRLHRRLLSWPDLPFYIWSVSLTLAIAVSVRHLMASALSGGLICLMAVVSLICCAFQFAAGRTIGRIYDRKEAGRIAAGQKTDRRYDTEVTSGQAMGQKNTVFIIWVAYTFMSPETAIIGGLYSIWHNIYNAWQLHRVTKKSQKDRPVSASCNGVRG